MKRERFEQKVEKWLHSEPSKTRIWLKKVRARYHSLPARKVSRIGVVHWLTRVAIAASPPALALFYGIVEAGVALIALAALAILQMVADWLGGLRESRRRRSDYSDELVWVRVNDLLATLSNTPTDQEYRDDNIRACLALIEGYARQVTRSKRGDVSVSLVLYEEPSREQMTIKHRDPETLAHRPAPRTFGNLQQLFGHRACEAGPEPRRIDDVWSFGRDSVVSPTQSRVSYRSIFIIPIQSFGDPQRPAKGFLSIDCERPYAFFGEPGRDILIHCSGIIDHISLQV